MLLHERREVAPVEAKQCGRLRGDDRDDSSVLCSEVAGLAEGHPRSVQGVDHLLPVGVDRIALHLAGQDDEELVRGVADVADVLTTNQVPRSCHSGERLDLIARHALKEVRAGEACQDIVIRAHAQ